MIKKLLLIGTVVGYIASCGPDTVNNNYYSGKGNGSSGSYYTCDDLGQAQLDCLSRVKEGLDQGYATAVADVCRKNGISQDCIDCVATAPCTTSSPELEDPLNFCLKQGVCPLH